MMPFSSGPLVEKPQLTLYWPFSFLSPLWKAFTKRVAFIGPPDSTRERGKTWRGFTLLYWIKGLTQGNLHMASLFTSFTSYMEVHDTK